MISGKSLVNVTILLALTSTRAASADNPATSDREWRVYLGDRAGSQYSELDQIDKQNVGDLRPAWIYRCREMGTIQCNPLVAHGLLYLASPALECIAIDAATGEERWVFSPTPGQRQRGICRGFTYWESEDHSDRRLFFPSGRYVFCLDARTGELIESFAEDGRLDMQAGMDSELARHGVSLKTPGVVYGDLLILGSNVGEGPSPAAPGDVRAFDVRSGEQRWVFRTVPRPGEFGYETWSPDSWKTVGGANCWAGLVVDRERGMVVFGTGSPSYDHYGGNRVGMNLFGNCVVALDARSGKRRWHFQTVHHDLWDYDISSPPNLVTLERDGRKIDAVAQPTKMGHLFVLDRETGEPLFPVEERPVPRSEVPGEASWPTQPFPPDSLVYGQQRLTENEVTDLDPEAARAVRERLAGMVTGDIFIPPGFTPSVVLPQFNGGSEWGGAAYDPVNGRLFVSCSNEAEWTSMRASAPGEAITLGELGTRLLESVCANCHGSTAPQVATTGPLPPLETVNERLTAEDALAVLTEGRNQMPPFAALSATERRAIISVLYGRPDLEQRVAKEDLTNSWSAAIPYVGTGHHDFRDPRGYPVNRRPWGTLNAIDLNEGRIAWQVPLGTYPELEKEGIPPTGTFNMGGPLVTAGGLVFIGGTMDERFHAYDKESGELLWEYQLDAGGYATPATYAIDGKQYIVIAAGGAGKPGTKPGNAYYGFALSE